MDGNALLRWWRRLWEYKGPPPRGIDCMDVPPPVPTDATPEEIVATTIDYDG